MKQERREREGYADVNGVRLYYKILGRGRPVFVLHGGPGLEHTYLFSPLSALAGKYTMVFYDQRAVGRSTGEVDESSLTLANYLNDLDALRRFLRYEKINLLGHSWGGLLALHYALSYGDHVQSIILAGSAGASSEFWKPFSKAVDTRITEEDREELRVLTDSGAFGRREAEAVSGRDRILFRSYFHDRDLAEKLELNYTERTARNAERVNNLIHERVTGAYDIRDALPGIKKPVLILHGDSDPIPMAVAEEIHVAIRGSEFSVLKSCGHFPFIECQEEFFEKVGKFLKSQAH